MEKEKKIDSLIPELGRKSSSRIRMTMACCCSQCDKAVTKNDTCEVI